jgi:hypothetical protein
MERPTGVTILASAFFLTAGYLFAVGLIELVAPGAFPPLTLRHAPFMYGRELDGPQSAILVSAGWALVGRGLMKVQNWGRWAAVVLMVLGIAAGIPAVSAASINPGWRLAWYGGQMMAKVAAAWYLVFGPDAIEAFNKAESGR